MGLKSDIQVYFADIRSENERKRDLAVEYLGDILENELGDSTTQQEILIFLGEQLINERSDIVTESILNALSCSVNGKFKLELPLDKIEKVLPSLQGSAKDHAKYILQGS